MAPWQAVYGLQDWLLAVRIPQGSSWTASSLAESDLPATFGLSVLAIARTREIDGARRRVKTRSPCLVPTAGYTLYAGDVVWLKGQPENLAIMRGLQDLQVRRQIDMSKRSSWNRPRSAWSRRCFRRAPRSLARRCANSIFARNMV